MTDAGGSREVNGDEVGDRIRSIRITPVRIVEGYEMGPVDQFLDALETTARQGGDLGALVRTAHFPRVRLREGYKIDEVDRFLAELATIQVSPGVSTSEVRAGAPTSSASAWAIRGLVERVRFTPVRLREGYDMGDVDRLLDAVVAAAERGEPVGPVIDAARFTPVRVREGYDMGEVDRFLAQIKGGVVPAGADPGVIHEQRGFVDRILERIRPRS